MARAAARLGPLTIASERFVIISLFFVSRSLHEFSLKNSFHFSPLHLPQKNPLKSERVILGLLFVLNPAGHSNEYKHSNHHKEDNRQNGNLRFRSNFYLRLIIFVVWTHIVFLEYPLISQSF